MASSDDEEDSSGISESVSSPFLFLGRSSPDDDDDDTVSGISGSLSSSVLCRREFVEISLLRLADTMGIILPWLCFDRSEPRTSDLADNGNL